MKRGIILDNKGEITPFLRNVIIVASLFIAVFIVLLVVYNVVNQSSEKRKAESEIVLTIAKNSVKVDEGVLKLSVSGKLEDLELKKVKFIINDGTNEENISIDAEDFETQKSFEINLKELGIDYTKKMTISIKPIIKKLTGEKELKVTDKISLSPTGETKQEEIPVKKEEKISTTIISCDKCGGLLGKGCDKLLCHSISEGCYYKGGFTRDCASCSEISCGQYKTQDDCSINRCKLGSCIWENKECIKNPECGNSVVTASANEECDDGNVINTDSCTNYCKNAICSDGYLKTGTEQCDSGGANGIACTPGYGGGTCTYCSSECISVVLTGGTCGDSICTQGSETPANCPGDCVGCGDGTCGGGETCNSCLQDCGICYTYSWYSGSWGTCSLTCGGGTQTRIVYCKRNSDSAQVADSYCTETKPSTSQICNTQECIWLLGEYHTETDCISIRGTVISSPHICKVSGTCSSGWSYHENWGSWSATICTGADITRTGNCGTKTLGGGTSCTISAQDWANSPAPASCTYKKPSISVWAWGCGSACTSGADCTDGDTACCGGSVIYHSRYMGGCGNYNPGQCDYSMEYLILNDGTCNPTRLESGCK